MRSVALFTLVFCLLLGCSQPEPVTIGFIGGLTGRTADLGSHSRNGMLLAIEQWNEAGGIQGQAIQTLIKDDKQNAEQAKLSMQELIEANVTAIVGPSTSAMAVEVAELANQAGISLIGTTVTTNQLKDIDDTFFRTVSATQNSSAHLSSFLQTNLDIEHFAVVQDLSNRAYTESWKNDFIDNMAANNITVNFDTQFTSGDNLALLEVSQQLTQTDTDLIVLVTNSTDAALLVKQIRSKNKTTPIVTCEWAGTSQFIQLAGRDAEGIYVPRYIDDASTDTDFIALKEHYKNRFQQDMGYPGLLAYNATNIFLEAIQNKTPEQTIKSYLLDKRVFKGVLATFELNEFGDEIRNAFHFITQVQDGQFITVED